MQTISVAEMREAENRAVSNGVELIKLMENAGTGAAIDLLKRFPESKKTLVICGKGNNGGDALVMARLLALKGWRVEVCLLLGRNLSDLSQANLDRLPSQVEIISVREALNASCEVMIDGVFGTGFSGEMRPGVKEFMGAMNRKAAYKVALDVPSGIDCDLGVAAHESFVADVTYVFHAYKKAHAMENLKKYFGDMVLVDIGIV